MKIIPVVIYLPQDYPFIDRDSLERWEFHESPKTLPLATRSEECLKFIPSLGDACLYDGTTTALYCPFIFADEWEEYDMYTAVALSLHNDFDSLVMCGAFVLLHEPPKFLGFHERIWEFWSVMFDVVEDYFVYRFNIFRRVDYPNSESRYVMDYNKYKKLMAECDRLLAERAAEYEEKECVERNYLLKTH
jgi:hypothetical protein